MKTRRFSLLAIVFLAWSASHSIPASAQECLSAGCHQELATPKGVHQPTADGECLACHEQMVPEHPLPNRKSFHLPVSGAPLCYQCHDEEGQNGKVHPPVAAGDCLACHDPHGSANRHLLKTPMPNLCLECHPEIRTATRSRVRHAAVLREKSCGTCHTGHSSKVPALLVAGEKELCISCHGKELSSRSEPLRNIGRELAGKPYLHGPIADGECSACHAPHGSAFSRLLRQDYPSGPYVPYTKGTFALCFECHDSALLKSIRTTTETGFRDGDRNLHYLHAADPRKGRACTTCHAAHASNIAGLINESVKFGAWEIPVNFKATGTGGSCAPGCHTAVQYDRSKAVILKQ